MGNLPAIIQVVVATVGAGFCCGLLCYGFQVKRLARARKINVIENTSSSNSKVATGNHSVIAYATKLTTRLISGTTKTLFKRSSSDNSQSSRSARFYYKYAKISGYSKEISLEGFKEAKFRLAVVGAAAGLAVGSSISIVCACALAMAGLILGQRQLPNAFKVSARARSQEASLHLSEMLEIVGLGLRSGLSFDRSFQLYGAYFENNFALACTKAHRSWMLGIGSREDALKELSESYDCNELSRIVDSIIRGLKFGTPLAGLLSEAGSQARASYRSTLEERVAKAPVKMMLPTGALILPAMLLLVMGPVLLELAAGF